MELKSNQAHSGTMLLWLILLVLVVWGVVATFRTVRVDGLRRRPVAPIVRRPEHRA